ncbi:DUF551 domain-containing protein [Klebsiella aerogenes]|uniref:DUF551 domain-containing protein n=1 Tax=Klebsiella aerogenes TaxID=548 RepID=UPI003D34B350|nr:DUF551 domain-containing protein [Klebsiella aerogenes]
MTNNQLTKEWLQQTIAELESVRDEIPFGIDTNSELELAAFKMALAAMDSEPVGSNYRKLFTCTGCGAEGLDEPLETNCHCCVDGAHWVESRLYRHAQPAPVVPEEMTPQQASRSYGGEVRGYRDGWNACRAAMLQAGNCRENANSSTNNFREITETSTNSPVIPDAWIPVSERMPENDVSVLTFDGMYKRVHHAMYGHWQCWEPGKITHWMPLPAAPQEVK